MRPEPAKFTKANPCTKRELWSCFRHASGYHTVQVDAAHAIIGLNAPRYLESRGYLLKERRADGDYYRLTAVGRAWLERGIRAYVKNHPTEAGGIPFLGPAPSVRRVRRVRR